METQWKHVVKGALRGRLWTSWKYNKVAINETLELLQKLQSNFYLYTVL